MSRLKLSNQSKQLLAAQVRLTGTFYHDLKTAAGTMDRLGWLAR